LCSGRRRGSSDSWCYVRTRTIQQANILLNNKNCSFIQIQIGASMSSACLMHTILDSSLSQSCLPRAHSKKVKSRYLTNLLMRCTDLHVCCSLVWMSTPYKLLKRARAFHIFLMFLNFFCTKYSKRRRPVLSLFQVTMCETRSDIIEPSTRSVTSSCDQVHPAISSILTNHLALCSQN
jgi:hypothetical protein